MTATTATAGPEPGPRSVSRFEANLLRVLRFLLGQLPPEQALPLLGMKPARPSCLSAACVELVQDSLAKGCVLYLARAGGWRRERFLRNGEPAEGRLWERSPAADVQLTFSRHALSFLIWLTAGRGDDPKSTWRPPVHELTCADLLLVFLAHEALRETDAGRPLWHREAVVRNALVRLAHPGDFAGEHPGPDFAPWLAGPGALMLEALQPVLAARLLAQEHAKGTVGDWARLRAAGRAQEAVLAAFLAAADAAGRRDLARFVLRTAGEVLSADMPLSFWAGGLQGPGPQRLADRIEARQAALGLLRETATLRRWAEAARGVGYFEDGYAAAQFWLSDWERARGDEAARRAQDVLRQAEPLRGPGRPAANEGET